MAKQNELMMPVEIAYLRDIHYQCQRVKDNGQQCRHTVNTRSWEEYGDRICTHHRFADRRKELTK